MPRDDAARPRFPDERFTAPTMYFFSNSFFARSREMPWARSSSMICWSCPSRFTFRLRRDFSRGEKAGILAKKKTGGRKSEGEKKKVLARPKVFFVPTGELS